MSNYRWRSADEHNHSPGTEPNFNESVYVNGFDLAGGYGGWMRLGNRVNEGHAETQVCMYLPDGRIGCQFLRPDIDNNDVFAAGGLHYEVLEAERRVRMVYEGELMMLDDPGLLRRPRELFEKAPREQARVAFEFDATSPVHGGEPLTDEQDTWYGRDFSFGHFFQHGRTGAEFRLGEERYDFNGCGWRDHSWGPRYWTNIWFYRLLIANFGPEHGICLLKITGRDGVTRRFGVVQVDGDYEEITDLDIVTRWNQDYEPEQIELGVRTAERGVTLHGELINLAPLSNRRKVGDDMLRSRIAEGLTRWTWGERRGIGVTEYIEFLEDGVPVGYPS